MSDRRPEELDPTRLIGATATLVRRRGRVRVALTALPPAAAIVTLLATGRLPTELLAAGVIALALTLIGLYWIERSDRGAALLLDRATAGRDHFLTLATVEAGAPLRALVDEGARRLASGVDLRRLAPPIIDPGKLRRSILLSLLGLLATFYLTTGATSPASHDLGAIAARLAASADAADRQLAAELRELARTLADPSASPAEKRRKVEAALARAESQQDGGRGASGSGGKKGGKQGGSESGASATSGAGDARGEARGELEKLASQIGSAVESHSGSGSRDDGKRQEGGGIKGPEEPKGAGERRDAQGEGNRPSETGGRSGEEKGGGNGAAARPPNQPGPAESEGKGNLPAAGGSGGSGQKPEADGEGSKREERYYEPGEGPGAWRIEDGRYVRVRVPERGSDATDVDTVPEPGIPRPETPFGNAPLPSVGPPGEVRETQPLPIEYREVLGVKQ